MRPALSAARAVWVRGSLFMLTQGQHGEQFQRDDGGTGQGVHAIPIILLARQPNVLLARTGGLCRSPLWQAVTAMRGGRMRQCSKS